MKWCLQYILCGATDQLGAWLPHCWGLYVTLLDIHTHTHIHGRTPLNKWSARNRDRYLHNTQERQELNIPALSGIRTHDPSKSATLQPIHIFMPQTGFETGAQYVTWHPGYQVLSCSQYVLRCVVLEMAGVAGGGPGCSFLVIQYRSGSATYRNLAKTLKRRLPTVSHAFELPITYRIL